MMGSKIGAVIDPKGEILARLKHDIENRRLDRYNISGSVISNIQNSFKSQGKWMISPVKRLFRIQRKKMISSGRKATETENS